MSKILLKIFFNFLYYINSFLKLFGKNTFLQKINVFINQETYLKKKINNTIIKFFVPNDLTYNRVSTIFSKEPETINWIQNFNNLNNKEIIFWDVGANIGLYSVYAAAVHDKIKITSFEASTSNLRCLSRNISINNFQNKIKICQIPLSNKENTFLEMKEKTFLEGGAISTFGENFDYKGQKILNSDNNYSLFGTTINFFLDNKFLEVPNYIKIDVDGIEHLILEGANKFLNHKQLLGISVELNKDFKDQFEKSFKLLESNGFYSTPDFDNVGTLVEKKHKTKNYHFKKRI